MTRRELINALLNGDMNEDIWFFINDGDADCCYSIEYVDNDVVSLINEEER